MPSHFRALFVLPSFDRNGAVDFIVDLAGAMASQPCEVEILVLSGETGPARGPKESVTVSIASGLTSTHNARSRSKIRLQVQRACHILSLFKDVMRSVSRADIVILTWEYGRALLLPSIAAFILRKPTIAIVQNNIQRSIVDYRSAGWQRVLRWAYARARAVVCISHDQIILLRQIGVPESNIVTIPNGVDVERIRTLAKHLPPAVLTVDDIPFVVSVGRLSSQKGFDILIRAHAEVLRRGIKHRLVLIGYGPDKDKLTALAAELGVSDTILFLGYQENPFPAMLRSSVYCLSSRFEGRPLTLSEAALLGVPIIAADCPTGPREILADGLYGDLVEPESVEALTIAMEKHFRDPQRLIDKSQAAKEDSDRYSIKVCAKSYVSLIRQKLR